MRGSWLPSVMKLSRARRADDCLEVVAVVDGQGEAGERHESVAGEDNAPGVARDDIHIVAVLEVELFGGVLEAVEERGAGGSQGYLTLVHSGERAGLDGFCAGRENDGLALLDGNREIAGHPEVFGVGFAAFEVAHILDVVIPIGFVDPDRLARELHVERGVTIVEAGADAVVDGYYLAVDVAVGHDERV